MGSHPTATRFHTTSWTLIVRARASREDLEVLLGRYWSPVYAFLRRSGWKREDAQDLTQTFLGEVLPKRDLVGRADPLRGRFRSFLLSALRNFATDARRKGGAEAAARRGGCLPDDVSELELAEPTEAHDPPLVFDRQWAAAVFDQAFHRTQDVCQQQGMTRHWRVFEARVVLPILHGCKPVEIKPLIDELGARDRQEIYDLLRSTRRKFQSMLREVVAETIEDPAEVDEELAELRRILSSSMN